jgi:YggT family protein
MIQIVALFDQLLRGVRFILVVSAGLAAAFCILDWLVRTRRVNLFGSLARFARSRIDPVLEPIERRVLAAGGNPASAPLWALAAVVVGGILLVSVLDFLRAEIVGLAFALQEGPRGMLKLLVSWTFDFVRIAILIRVVSSWLPVSPYSGWVRWSYVVSEPLLKPIRQLIPAIGGAIDITPIIVYFILGFIQNRILLMM